MSQNKINVIELRLDDEECLGFCGDLHADSCGPESRIDDYLDTVVGKLNSIYESCIEKKVKALLFTGDIFSRISVPHECVNVIGNAFMRFKRAEIQTFTILGNHDIVRNNLDRIERSPISTLFTFNALTELNLKNRIVVNKKLLITSVNYTEPPLPADPRAKYNLLLAHMFYKASELFGAGVHNIEEKDLINWGYDCIVLGHDHTEYPIMRVGKTDIIRPGSVMRATAHDYNFQRIPVFYILKNPSEYSVTNFEKVIIKAKPFEEIASNSVITKKDMNSLGGIQDILSSLAQRIVGLEDDSEGDRIVEKIKKDENLTPEIRQILFNYFQEAGIFV
jgi:DNA repair exonuclease SbcCD nuclease subunit